MEIPIPPQELLSVIKNYLLSGHKLEKQVRELEEALKRDDLNQTARKTLESALQSKQDELKEKIPVCFLAYEPGNLYVYAPLSKAGEVVPLLDELIKQIPDEYGTASKTEEQEYHGVQMAQYTCEQPANVSYILALNMKDCDCTVLAYAPEKLER